MLATVDVQPTSSTMQFITQSVRLCAQHDAREAGVRAGPSAIAHTADGRRVVAAYYKTVICNLLTPILRFVVPILIRFGVHAVVVHEFFFLPRDAMLARYLLSSCVRLFATSPSMDASFHLSYTML